MLSRIRASKEGSVSLLFHVNRGECQSPAHWVLFQARREGRASGERAADRAGWGATDPEEVRDSFPHSPLGLPGPSNFDRSLLDL